MAEYKKKKPQAKQVKHGKSEETVPNVNKGLPESYDDWKNRITKNGNVTLKTEFVQQRITQLKNTTNPYTQRLVNQHGAKHLERLIAWFEMIPTETKAVK